MQIWRYDVSNTLLIIVCAFQAFVIGLLQRQSRQTDILQKCINILLAEDTERIKIMRKPMPDSEAEQ